jgi:hypothetical protein
VHFQAKSKGRKPQRSLGKLVCVTAASESYVAHGYATESRSRGVARSFESQKKRFLKAEVFSIQYSVYVYVYCYLVRDYYAFTVVESKSIFLSVL